VFTRTSGTHLLRERFGEVQQGGLGGAVFDNQGIGKEGFDRADRHNGARAAVEQMRQRRAGAADGDEEVDGQRLGPVLVRHGEKATESRADGTDIVDKDVQPAKGRNHLVNQACGAIRGAQIHRDKVLVEAIGELGEVACQLSGAGDDPCTLRGERLCHRQADPFAGASDDGGLSSQVQIHGSLLLSATDAVRFLSG
jgi:hypothetical protein